MTILWLYGAALLAAAVLGGVMHGLWGDRSGSSTGAEAEQFVRDVADPAAGYDWTAAHRRARDLVTKWNRSA